MVEAISGRDEPGFETLSPDAKLLRAFDLAGVAISALAEIRPLALLIDDVQWADDDTLRLLRYVVRSDADRPIFLLLTVRPDEFASVTEAVNFIADMERMGVVRRLRPGRFGSVETGELLKRVLGGPVETASAAAMHVQSEGVPFIVEELARTHREAGTLQQIDGEWRLGRNAARLVPSAVRTLIDRRAARLPARTRAALGDAAILGRSFSLRDLRAIRQRVGEARSRRARRPRRGVEQRRRGRRPADCWPTTSGRPSRAGLLLPQAQGEPADYTFTHEQVRQFAANQLSAARRRQVHAAVVDLLLEGGDPDPAGLPMLAQHALAAGDTVRAARFSIDAATAALAANAPEEALRLVEQALPVVSTPADRRVLLATRDDAFAVLRRTGERLDGLTELAALAEAMRDPAIELDVQLRRASALRMSHDEDAAAELARRVRARAAEQGDVAMELRATLELGQALLRSPLGESFGGTAIETDLDGAEEAYRRAIELAEQLHDDRSLAAALREIGMIDFARGRAWFSGEVLAGRANELVAAVATGADFEEMILASPIGPLFVEATRSSSGRSASSSGWVTEPASCRRSSPWPTPGTGRSCTCVIGASSRGDPARDSRLSELVTESERARLDLQMLFGVHVYSRAKVVPDLALSRGEDAHRAAKLQGDRTIEFHAAGGVAMSLLELGDIEGAERWIGLAAAAASMAPSRPRARQLEMWRGMARAGAGDAAGMRQHLERAVGAGDRGGSGVGAMRGPGPPRHRGSPARRGGASGGSTAPMGPAGPGAGGARRAVGSAGEGAAAAPARARAVGRAGRRCAGRGRARARRHRGRRHGRRRSPAGPPGRAPRGHQPGDRDPGGPGRARRRAAGDAGVRPGIPPADAGADRQGTADEKIRVAWLTGPVGRELVGAGRPDGHPALLRRAGSSGARQPGQAWTMPSAGCSGS